MSVNIKAAFAALCSPSFPNVRATVWGLGFVMLLPGGLDRVNNLAFFVLFFK